MLGAPVRERAEFVATGAGPLQPPRKVHRGWSWMCGCASFARDDSATYLYVPCVGHSALGRPPARASVA